MIGASAALYALGALGLLVFGAGFVTGIAYAVHEHEAEDRARAERIRRYVLDEVRAGR